APANLAVRKHTKNGVAHPYGHHARQLFPSFLVILLVEVLICFWAILTSPCICRCSASLVYLPCCISVFLAGTYAALCISGSFQMLICAETEPIHTEPEPISRAKVL
uniref:Uncharacterized protein n=1 Tax=Podarcis muralis TaxID=64176 RepID=A0A670IK90_PODMU